MPDKIEVEHIQLATGTEVQKFKLPQQMIDYLWERIDIAKKKQICYKKYLAGNISHSYQLEDPQNMILQNILYFLYNPDTNPKACEFINTEIESIFKRIGGKEFGLDPYLDDMWVNFQKKGEFQPIHNHSGAFSFVIWMDIPYHSKDEAKLPFANINCVSPHGGNFAFVLPTDASRLISEHGIELSPEMNGYCCFFPSDLSHQVYPFYTSDKDRISISGNISYHYIVKPKLNPPQVYQFPFHTSET